ncbi:MAG: PAS domain S-box protein [Deltaproteobacteria bacterium]|nr:PAS domain S-box protein [Deltaproteobacteria bacterium]
MKNLHNIIHGIGGISLKLKLLIPFLFFAFASTTILTIISLTSQQNLIKKEERNLLLQHYRLFLDRLDQKQAQAISIASSFADIPDTGRLLAEDDRVALQNYITPIYQNLKNNQGVSQLYFHRPPGISFLRLLNSEEHGKTAGLDKKSVSEIFSGAENSVCLEMGKAGLVTGGAEPVYYNGKIAGSVGVLFTLGKPFIDDYSSRWKINAAIYTIAGGKPERITAAGGHSLENISGIYKENGNIREPDIMISPEKHPDMSVLIGPVENCFGEVVALIVLNSDRTPTLKRLAGNRNLMVSAGIAVILISFLFIYLVIDLFIKPIKEIVAEAREIASGKRENGLDVKSSDEVGSLTTTLNTMIEALKNRRIEIEDYARTLERSVDERTSELLESEEKYRTMVENVPLVVYRILKDGTTEFVNSYLTENIGYTVEEALDNKRFWRDKIAGEAPEAFKTVWNTCFIKGEECRLDHKVRAKDGRLLRFITHSIPTTDENGEVKWVDGFMLDITELKRLEERAIQTEEVRTLGEISARMAHEIRNPLSIAGGFARRLRDAMKDDDPNKRLSIIIVEEVAKLEIFVTGLLSTITPFELTLSKVSINELILESIAELDRLLESRNLEIVSDLESNIPDIEADHKILCQAVINIIKHSIISSPQNENISVSTAFRDDDVVITITNAFKHMSNADIEQFFFPHIEQKLEESVLDLPLSKIIIHRHGGKINLIKIGENILKIIISFPVRPA